MHDTGHGMARPNEEGHRFVRLEFPMTRKRQLGNGYVQHDDTSQAAAGTRHDSSLRQFPSVRTQRQRANVALCFNVIPACLCMSGQRRTCALARELTRRLRAPAIVPRRV